jgi:hypothetical protein
MVKRWYREWRVAMLAATEHRATEAAAVRYEPKSKPPLH